MIYSKKTILSAVVLFFVSFVVFLFMVACEGMFPVPEPEPVNHTITASAGAYGSIDPEGKVVVNEGQDQTFTIIPDAGYKINDVLINGESIGAVEEYTFTNIEKDFTIEVAFKKKISAPATPSAPTYYTISTFSGLGGSIEPEGEITLLKGESQTFTITPDICYRIETLNVNGTEETVVGTSYMVTDIQQDYNIEVNFILSDKKIRRYNQSGELQNDDHSSIQEAINDSSEGDSIIVCPGTYHENLVMDGKKITVKSADPLNSDIVAATMIDGDIDEDEIGDGSVVSFINGDTSTLKGVTITNGTGTLMGSYTAGGGIFIDSSSPNISGNIIESNQSANGGGMFITGNSSPEIKENIIRTNKSTNYAGGIYIFGCSANITDNIVSGNATKEYGGGIYVYEGYGESTDGITNNIIENNAADSGGGIYLSNTSPVLKSNDIKGNTAINGGGGIYLNSSSPNIAGNNIITENSADNGGGIYINNSYNSITQNSINGNSITKNTASSAGGGIYLDNSMATITGNNRISENEATWGGGIYMVSSSPLITNNLSVNENSAQYGGGIFVGSGSSPDINKNNIKNNLATEENGGGGIFVHTNADSPNIGGADENDTDNFNTICGNSPDQIAPDEYEFNHITNECS